MERHSNHMQRPDAATAPVFLVLERDPLIAEDIMGSLQEVLPCRVLHATDTSGLAAQLAGEEQIFAAFLDLPFQRVLATGLDNTLAAHGARIILTVGEDDQAEALARGWGMLVRPFSEDMIRNLVMPKPLR